MNVNFNIFVGEYKTKNVYSFHTYKVEITKSGNSLTLCKNFIGVALKLTKWQTLQRCGNTFETPSPCKKA